MNILRDILYNAGITKVQGDINVSIDDIVFDSREVVPGKVFVAISGLKADGHDYIDVAINAGARAVICEKWPDDIDTSVVCVQVKSTSYALGIMACNFYDHPSKELKLIGVTGTNGKTTSVTGNRRCFTIGACNTNQLEFFGWMVIKITGHYT